MGNHKKPAPILKITAHQPRKELEFELDYQLSLTTRERFQMMDQASREILQQLINNGHLRPFEIIKRA